jgi:hypothetical protein
MWFNKRTSARDCLKICERLFRYTNMLPFVRRNWLSAEYLTYTTFRELFLFPSWGYWLSVYFICLLLWYGSSRFHRNVGYPLFVYAVSKPRRSFAPPRRLQISYVGNVSNDIFYGPLFTPCFVFLFERFPTYEILQVNSWRRLLVYTSRTSAVLLWENSTGAYIAYQFYCPKAYRRPDHSMCIVEYHRKIIHKPTITNIRTRGSFRVCDVSPHRNKPFFSASSYHA